MVIDEKESVLIDVAYEVLINRTHALEVFTDHYMGIEQWVRNELIVGLTIRGYEVTTENSVVEGYDLKVRKDDTGLDVGIELKADTSKRWIGFRRAMDEHPKADIYMFLAMTDSKKIEELIDALRDKGFETRYREISEWTVMLAKREN